MSEESAVCVSISHKHKSPHLSDDENRILETEYEIPNVRSKSAFPRHMIVYGAVYDVDYAYLRESNYLLGKIGGNLNQISKRINETRSIYQTDMDAVKAEMDRYCEEAENML